LAQFLPFSLAPTTEQTISIKLVDVGTFIQPFFLSAGDILSLVFTTQDVLGSFLKIFVVTRNDYLEHNAGTVEAMLADFWDGMVPGS
jgi:hypothetical protein